MHLHRLAEVVTSLTVGTEVERLAEGAFLDTAAAALAGARHPVVGKLRSALAGSGVCPTFGGGWLDAPEAALVNGTAAHALDMDDNLAPAAGHVSAVVVPAVQAAGAELGAEPGRMLAAYCVGAETMARLGLAFNMRHYHAGWHSTSTLGAVAAAAGCAWLASGDAGAVARAIAIAASFASGTKAQFGTEMKPVHAGWAARNGVLAARLERTGIGAAADPLFATMGLHATMAGDPEGPERALAPGGWVLAAHGLMQKVYPCCAAMHRALDAVLVLRELLPPEGPGAVESVRVELAATQTQNLAYTDPATPEEARFSLPYCIARALADGRLGLSEFTPKRVRDPDLRPLMARVEMVEDPAYPGTLPADADVSNRVVLRLADGSERVEVVTHQRGHGCRPLTRAELKEKFAEAAHWAGVDMGDAADGDAVSLWEQAIRRTA